MKKKNGGCEDGEIMVVFKRITLYGLGGRSDLYEMLAL